MPDFIETMTDELHGRLADVERRLAEFDTLVQERDRLRAALDALGAGPSPSREPAPQPDVAPASADGP